MFSLVTSVLSKREISIKNHNSITAYQIRYILSITGLKKSNKLKMTYKLGTVKLFAFPFEIDTPNIISCAPQFFSCAPKISAVRLKIYIW